APGSHVVMIGAGFIAFTILNSILALGARLTIVEIAPRILPRMIDPTGAELVEAWLRRHGVAVRTGAAVTRIEDRGPRTRLRFKNIVEVCHLDVASFGAWDDPGAEAFTAVRRERPAYRKLLWRGDRLTGALILGRSSDVWTTNDIGMLKGLVQSGGSLAAWKEHLRR